MHIQNKVNIRQRREDILITRYKAIMNKNFKELMKTKEEILKRLEEINNNITKEDIKNASVAELAEYTKLTLEIQKKLAIIEEIEKANNM